MKIKFRIWDGEKMTYLNNCGYAMATLFFTNSGHNDTGSCNEGYNLDHVKVMQFIGMMDTNGKEIFEGDIVEYENGNAGYGRPRSEELSRYTIPPIMEIEDDMLPFIRYSEAVGNTVETE